MRLPPFLATPWHRASTRERAIVAVALGALAVLVGYFVLWTPLQDALARAETDLARSQTLLERARRQAEESAGLARSSAPLSGDAREAVERMLAQRGLRSSVASLDAREGRVRLVFADVRIDALVAALEGLVRESGLRPVEATLTARVEPGTVRADLTLTR